MFLAYWLTWPYGPAPRNCALFIASLAFHPAHRRVAVVAGVTTNLVALGYFKYMNFFVENFELLSGQALHLARVVLPIGISFFTFTQIAYLVDARCWREVSTSGIVAQGGGHGGHTDGN